MRTQQEMLEVFAEHPQAVWNTGVIADQCNFEFPSGKLFFPSFEIPEGYSQESYFSHLCAQGLQELIERQLIPADQIEAYRARLQLEVDLITTMGFIGYFLIVSDFIQWAKNQGIPVGPGRGSVVASLVAWSLKITNVDPIKYNLFFERFLNPERISMPDIDIDFCVEGRERVIDYIRERYGKDHVGQIITFGTLMAKGVVKDVARALGLPFEDSNAITSLIGDQLKITLHEALEKEPRLRELVDQNPQVHKIFDIAFRLEGLTRHASKHAAGIVISPEPIDQVLPVYVPSKSTELVTQYAMTELEALGFLKIDLLGLKNLTIIDYALKRIKQSYGIILDLDHIDLEDKKTFELLCQGRTSAVFQLESKGIKEVLIKLQPDKFEDIIAVNALYRPGPLGSGMVDDFVARRHGKQEIKYFFKELAPILEETYGVIAYQEQVMGIASIVAGYSLGESDILRRAMGKKKVDVMAQQKELFLERAQTRSFDSIKAGELFDLMAYFAEYGFNKAHSTAYALIAYHTAYLKAHYPAEFMASVISLESGNAEAMSFYLQEAKDCGVVILTPDVNTSSIDFCVEDNAIRFGLQGIKNIGPTCLEDVIAQRAKDGKFKDLLDFCQRVDLRTCNKRVLENLICAGAMDSLPGNRAQKYTELSVIIEKALQYKKSKLTGQLDFFGASAAESTSSIAPTGYVFALLDEWDNKTKLDKEHEVIGFFLSSHPLSPYDVYAQWMKSTPLSKLPLLSTAKNAQEPEALIYGMLSNIKTIITKKGDKMAFASLEDQEGKAEIILFPKVYEVTQKWLDKHTIFIIKGTIDTTNPVLSKVKAIHCVPLELFFAQWPENYTVRFKLRDTMQDAKLLEPFMHSSVTTLKGSSLEVFFKENDKNLCLMSKGYIDHDNLVSLHQQSIEVSIVI